MEPAEPAVVVPVPPLIMPRVPETSEEPKATAPLFSSPPTDLTSPVPKEDRVVEPEGLTVSRAEEVEEAITKGLTLPVPTTVKVPSGVVVLMPILEEDSKRMELAVAEAPVALMI